MTKSDCEETYNARGKKQQSVNSFKNKQDCSYQGEVLNVPTAF